MREILFRGKRVDGNGWIEGSLIDYGFGRFCISVIPKERDGRVEQFSVIPETVGQYTGLKGDDGVKIFENDVIKYYQPYSKKWEIHIVKWDDMFAVFGMFEKGNKWCVESDWVKIQEIEVLGNAHDNPELLEETT